MGDVERMRDTGTLLAISGGFAVKADDGPVVDAEAGVVWVHGRRDDIVHLPERLPLAI